MEVQGVQYDPDPNAACPYICHTCNRKANDIWGIQGHLGSDMHQQRMAWASPAHRLREAQEAAHGGYTYRAGPGREPHGRLGTDRQPSGCLEKSPIPQTGNCRVRVKIG